MCNNNLELKGDVIHVTSCEKSVNWNWEKYSDMVDKRIQFVSIDDIPLIRAKSNVDFPEVYENDILVKHPYKSNSYLLLRDAAAALHKDKWLKISEIVQCLGVSEFCVKEAKESIETRELASKVGIEYKPVRTGIDIKNENKLKEKLGLKICDKFDGVKIISEKSYKEAQELAAKYNLIDDIDIRSLIMMRDPRKENQQHSRTIHCEMTKELNSLLDIAFSLNVMPNVFSLGVDIKKTLERKETITVDITFIFPD